NQKTLQFFGERISGEHLVVAEGAIRLLRATHVGLNPQNTAAIKPQAVGAGEMVFGCECYVASAGAHVATQQENVPRKGMSVGIFTPADNMAGGVIGAWIRCIGFGAASVIGKGKVNFASFRMHRTPFRA